MVAIISQLIQLEQTIGADAKRNNRKGEKGKLFFEIFDKPNFSCKLAVKALAKENQKIYKHIKALRIGVKNRCTKQKCEKILAKVKKYKAEVSTTESKTIAGPYCIFVYSD